jgi:glutaredoxin
MKKKFIVFGTEDCDWCNKAQELGNSRASVEYIQITKAQAKAQGFPSVPAVFEYVEDGYQGMLAGVLRGETE